MTMQKLLKRIHILGTAWFLFCAAALLVISLRQAGVNWWLIFSISGYSVVLFTFLLAFYLFALFRGVVRAQCVEEHPLSTSPAYLFMYDTAPFWGAVAGLVVSFGVADWTAAARMITEGTLGMTFVTWVILDSMVGAGESMLPKSILHRSKRLAHARAEKQRIQKENAALLESLERSEVNLRRNWEETFRDIAASLAELYCSGKSDIQQVKQLAVETGAKAWQVGKLPCMRFVQQMILSEMNRCSGEWRIDFPAIWWDGIGSWRRPKDMAASILCS